MTVVDTHQHNLDFSKFEYRWVQPGTVLAQDYLWHDAQPAMQAAGVDACVLVEAGVNQPEELLWFLELAAQHAPIRGVVGYIDLHGDVPAVLESLTPDVRPFLKGVRIGVNHRSADSPAPDAGFQALIAHDLTCDLLIQNQSLAQAQSLVTAHPDLTFILDHFAGARITHDGYHAWREQLAPLAAVPNTVMKVSGYLTASDPMPPTIDLLRPYLEIALELFGASRLMYGSDWPVCLRGDSYTAGVHLLQSLTQTLTPDEQADIWGRTAIKTYHL